ncbi:ATP-binding cassette domain-containing protein [Actinomyces vulturis]|uniref:ATP-binding cassette domain-containing protein n=1 Tax=Actinomyces vulturis TaxID=1857645 RepID=UPI001146ADC5
MPKSTPLAHNELILDNDQLAVFRGQTPIVQNFSLRVHPGDIIAITSESGYRKSTLLEAILELIPHQAGRVTVAGKNNHVALHAGHGKYAKHSSAQFFKMVRFLSH